MVAKRRHHISFVLRRVLLIAVRSLYILYGFKPSFSVCT